jgi:hypothetical protein
MSGRNPTKPQLLEQNIALEKQLDALRAEREQLKLDLRSQKEKTALAEAIEAAQPAKAPQGTPELEYLKIIADRMVAGGEDADEREKARARKNDSHKIPAKSFKFANGRGPGIMINNMIVLEYDEWRLAELREHLKLHAEGSDLHTEFLRLIKELQVKIVNDFLETQKREPKDARPFMAMYKEAQVVAKKALEKKQKAIRKKMLMKR